MTGLVKGANEQGSRARSDRFVGQGRVVSINPTKHTCRIDCGATDTQGNPVYLEDIAYQPQSPPSTGDGVTLAYQNASPHSLYVAGGRLSGTNQQNTLTTIGGVTSVAVVGHSKIVGDVTLTAGTNCTLTEAGNNITFDVASGGMSVEVNGASATAAPRSLLNLIEGGGVVISIADVPASNRVDITVGATFGTIPPTAITAGASPYSVPGGDFAIFADTTGGAIAVVLPAPAANHGRLLVLLNDGSGSNAITLTSATGAVVGVTSIPVGQTTWYISNGVNWYSFTSSGGTSTAATFPVNILEIPPLSWVTPAAATEFGGVQIYRAKHDLTNASQIRLLLFNAAFLSIVSPSLVAEYSSDGGLTWHALDGSSGPSVAYTPGAVDSGWVTLDAGAKGDVLLKIEASGGDNSTTQNYGSLRLQAR